MSSNSQARASPTALSDPDGSRFTGYEFVMSSRSGRVEPLDVREILRGNGPSGPPVEHVSTPSSPAGRPASQSHDRARAFTTEMATDKITAPRTNRFSMSFPVQPSPAISPTRTTHSPVREAHDASTSVISSTGPTDTNFLTAIAAQERRVLELKEELARAETELNKLKMHWQQHEAQKKRNDARSLTKLQPLQSPLPAAEIESDSDGSNVWMQQEMQRRKTLLSGSKSSNRRVFSGSKHTRALSLLSPANRGHPTTPSIPRQDIVSQSARRSQEAEGRPPRPAVITRSSTTPDLSVDGTKAAESQFEPIEASIDREILIQTGKKVATGLRDGLWTFWEDLRQATVGDEATQISPPHPQSSTQTPVTAKKRGSKTSMRPSSRGSSPSKRASPVRKHAKSATVSLSSAPALADPSFWTQHGIITHETAATPVKRPSSRRAETAHEADLPDSAGNEAWDDWDEGYSPASGSSFAISESNTLPTTVSGPTSPRRSKEINSGDTRHLAESSKDGNMAEKGNERLPRTSSRKDPIPWPALSNLGPKALRRTASHLMSEWEKSLTPSPTKETPERQGYMGLGAEAEAASLPGDRKRT